MRTQDIPYEPGERPGRSAVNYAQAVLLHQEMARLWIGESGNTVQRHIDITFALGRVAGLIDPIALAQQFRQWGVLLPDSEPAAREVVAAFIHHLGSGSFHESCACVSVPFRYPVVDLR